MRREDFHYELPPDLVAQEPLPERTASRLLMLPCDRNLRHLHISDLPACLRSGDLLVLNDTKVIKARLRGVKDSGGAVEVLVERLLSSDEVIAQVRASKPLKAGRRITLAGDEDALTVTGREGPFYRLRFAQPVSEVLEAHGEVPLPPYMERPAVAADEARYQTVFASRPGAVAAPTAGLHLDEALLQRLGEMGVEHTFVTLHVGAGTFQPVRADDLDEHVMHQEWFEVGEQTAAKINEARREGRRVVAVGTTVVRTLESIMLSGDMRAHAGETQLFIRPGFPFRAVDAMLTNFHLPESTLLMLVSAFAGYERIMAAYRTAVAERYRFFSYGDAMFLERADV